MELLLIIGIGMSAIGASAYAVAYEQLQRQQRNNNRVFGRMGKNGYAKHDRS